MREQLLIGGSWRDGAGRGRIDVANPATGEVITSIADGTPADAAAAVEAASVAQVEWAKVAPRQRAEILRSCWADTPRSRRRTRPTHHPRTWQANR